MTEPARAAVDVLRLSAAPVVFLGLWCFLLTDALEVTGDWMRRWDLSLAAAGPPLFFGVVACTAIAWKAALWVEVGQRKRAAP